MLYIFSKVLIYTALTFMAYACIQTANAINESTCKCDRHGLALVIVGCTTTFLGIFYQASAEVLSICISPLIIGSALWLIVSDAEAHHKFDKLVTAVKVRFYEAFGTFK